MEEVNGMVNDMVNAPRHYRSHPSGFECLEVTRRVGFDVGNAIKYVWRRSDKGSARQDLMKAAFYIGDALSHDPAALAVPETAARILEQVAAAEPDPAAAEFFRAAAGMRWEAAEAAVQKLIGQLEPVTSA